MATEFADMAQEVEHVLGKDEVTSSNLVNSSNPLQNSARGFSFVRMPNTVHIMCEKLLPREIFNGTDSAE